MANWYAKNTGSDLNSGSGDTDAAKVTRDSGTNGVLVAGLLTDTGATFQTSGVVAGDAINLIVAGTQTVRLIATVPSETTLTITAPPADASYDYRIGGRRAAINKAANASAGNNTALASGDRVWVRQHSTSTYNELVTLDTSGVTVLGPGATIDLIDGTGLGAGSDPITNATGNEVLGVVVVNAVDVAFARSAGSNARYRDCVADVAGGNGFANAASGRFSSCSARTCGGVGFTTSTSDVVGCQSRDNTSHGIDVTSGTGSGYYTDNLSSGNGGAGLRISGGSNTRFIENNTLADNVAEGLVLTATTVLGSASRIWCNALTGNGTYGVNSSAGAQGNLYLAAHNAYFGNVTSARNNFDADTWGGTTSDPAYSGSGNYSPGRTGSLYKAGSPAWDEGNAFGIGAVSPVTAAEETQISTPNYPAEGDVEDGVVYGSANEYEGTLVVSGGSGGGGPAPLFGFGF